MGTWGWAVTALALAARGAGSHAPASELAITALQCELM